tara:strand:+ start:935 stop:1189 length:255 start_codon:yes stop_codon:yes gene_type:complete
MRSFPYSEVILSVILIAQVFIIAFSNKEAKYQKQIQKGQIIKLKERIQQDSIHIEMVEYNYNVVMEENQIFGSLLAEKGVNIDD